MKKVTWSAPSNIALIKYWGKYGLQLPQNPSISLTLNNSVTKTTVECQLKEIKNEKIDFILYFEDKVNIDFRPKLKTFFENIKNEFNFLTNYKIIIKSNNTFPHSAGIASSASSMAALSLCLCSLNELINGSKGQSKKDFHQKASYISRLGSGSASRSVYPGVVSWGENACFPQCTQEEAFEVLQDIEWISKLQDTILIVSTKKKKVLSRQGHSLMEKHPYAAARYLQANRNFSELVGAITSNNFQTFAQIVEEEALSIHALMMSSSPGYSLLSPNSFIIIDKIREFREKNNVKICFTIDAGPNIHVLYPEKDKDKVIKFINNNLIEFCENGLIISDHVGSGPKQLESHSS